MDSTQDRIGAAGRAAQLLRPELTLVVLMAVIIGMLIIPMPTFLVDLLIGLNMAIAIVIFLSSFYVERILDFSTFPSVMLFSTLMRLALSVSTSRLILVDADAGHIIQAFGEFVIADNLVVGFVVFAIVTIVQFIVITKGSERIGEVAARFSLDGMPGKQMGIDADLRAEAITAEGAQQRRREVERESQLFGSYDGAMKFVKGDAIAGIVILFVNLFGGIAVGMLQKGMPFGEALHTFTLLTIGDGLVAQIPALLICISAGFIVTRVSGENKNLGESILGELFNSNTVLCVGAALVLLLGFLPGFPFAVFLVLAAGLFGLFLWRRRQAGADDGQAGPANAEAREAGAKPGTLDRMVADTMPIIVVMPPEHVRHWEKQGWSGRLKDQLFVRLGMRLPQLMVRADQGGGAHMVTVLINEVAAASAPVMVEHMRVLGDRRELDALQLGVVTSRSAGTELAWVPQAESARVSALGCQVRSDFDEIFNLVYNAVTRHINELFGIQETKQMLDEFEKKCPELVKEVYRHAPIQRLAEVLQRLLREGISIRNMRIILETLAQWAQREKDVILLVEHVRGALARYISARFARDGRVAALVVSPDVEDLVRSGIRQSQGAAYLNLEPAQANELLDRIVLHAGDIAQHRADAVLLVAPDIRRFVKRFIETRLPDMHVMSFSEVSDTVSIDVMKTI